VDARLSEWVPLAALSAVRPADPAETASDAEELIAGSDDFVRHREVFATAAARLIAEGACSERDFAEVGGWMKSVNEHRDEPVYFMYCGGMTTAHRIYLDARTGRTFR
jgi:hypothetical protein